jgi:hypothetical protein
MARHPADTSGDPDEQAHPIVNRPGEVSNVTDHEIGHGKRRKNCAPVLTLVDSVVDARFLPSRSLNGQLRER